MIAKNRMWEAIYHSWKLRLVSKPKTQHSLAGNTRRPSLERQTTLYDEQSGGQRTEGTSRENRYSNYHSYYHQYSSSQEDPRYVPSPLPTLLQGGGSSQPRREHQHFFFSVFIIYFFHIFF